MNHRISCIGYKAVRFAFSNVSETARRGVKLGNEAFGPTLLPAALPCEFA